jgi:hypothetical protein
MEEEIGYTDALLYTDTGTGGDGTDRVTRTDDNDSTGEDDYKSDGESWSSYDNLPEEDFQNKENGACSDNVSAVYVDFVRQTPHAYL